MRGLKLRTMGQVVVVVLKMLVEQATSTKPSRASRPSRTAGDPNGNDERLRKRRVDKQVGEREQRESDDEEDQRKEREAEERKANDILIAAYLAGRSQR